MTEARLRHWCPISPSTGPVVTPVKVRGCRDEEGICLELWGRHKLGTRTFGKIGSEILVQLVKVSFGDDG
jgi:hypothetical protein